MNTSQISSSSLSSSNETDDCYYRVMASFDQEQDLLFRTYANNNKLLAELNDYEEGDEAESRRRGAIPGHITYYRDRETAAYNIYMDYFAEVPVYPEHKFRRRYRMSRSLFLQIADAVKDHDNFFMQQRDGIGRSRSPFQFPSGINGYGDHHGGTAEYGGLPHYGASGGSSSSGVQGGGQQFGDSRRNDDNLPEY